MKVIVPSEDTQNAAMTGGTAAASRKNANDLRYSVVPKVCTREPRYQDMSELPKVIAFNGKAEATSNAGNNTTNEETHRAYKGISRLGPMTPQ